MMESPLTNIEGEINPNETIGLATHLICYTSKMNNNVVSAASASAWPIVSIGNNHHHCHFNHVTDYHSSLMNS